MLEAKFQLYLAHKKILSKKSEWKTICGTSGSVKDTVITVVYRKEENKWVRKKENR